MEAYLSNLRKKGHTVSCGCYHDEVRVSCKTTHGLSHTKLHDLWCAMRKRCSNSNGRNRDWHGRGIRVCKEWSDSFESFADWAIANGYETGLQIDRVDNDGDYCPENCRFATVKVQARNRRSSRLVEYHGETKTLAEWAERLGMRYCVLQSRLDRGWDLARS